MKNLHFSVLWLINDTVKYYRSLIVISGRRRETASSSLVILFPHLAAFPNMGWHCRLVQFENLFTTIMCQIFFAKQSSKFSWVQPHTDLLIVFLLHRCRPSPPCFNASKTRTIASIANTTTCNSSRRWSLRVTCHTCQSSTRLQHFSSKRCWPRRTRRKTCSLCHRRINKIKASLPLILATLIVWLRKLLRKSWWEPWAVPVEWARTWDPASCSTSWQTRGRCRLLIWTRTLCVKQPEANLRCQTSCPISRLCSRKLSMMKTLAINSKC